GLLIALYDIGTVLITDKSADSWTNFQKSVQTEEEEEQKLIRLTQGEPQARGLVHQIVDTLEPAHQFINRAEAVVKEFGSGIPVLNYRAWQHQADLGRI